MTVDLLGVVLSHRSLPKRLYVPVAYEALNFEHAAQEASGEGKFLVPFP